MLLPILQAESNIFCVIYLNSTTSKTASLNIFKICLNSKHLSRQSKCRINCLLGIKVDPNSFFWWVWLHGARWVMEFQTCGDTKSNTYCTCANCPVNLHPLFLFWKPGSVCDPEKKIGHPAFFKKHARSGRK